MADDKTAAERAAEERYSTTYEDAPMSGWAGIADHHRQERRAFVAGAAWAADHQHNPLDRERRRMTIHDRPMTFHPLDSAISAGVRACDELGAPVPKYTVVVEIIGNSREEILKRIRSLDTNWDYEYCERDEIDSTDGTTTIRMRHTNPAQTPEEYYQALMAWASARREARRASSDAQADAHDNHQHNPLEEGKR